MPLSKDRLFIYTSAFLRACATSLSGVILALFLSSAGWDVRWIGILISVGLLGTAAATVAVIFLTHQIGKRKNLALLGLLMTAGGLAYTSFKQPGVLFCATFFGMMNGMGRDRGAGLTLEQAILPQTVPDKDRTKVFAWYNVFVDAGHAAGSLLGFFPAFFRNYLHLDPASAYASTWCFYSLLTFAAALFPLFLSSSVEIQGPELPHVSPESKRIITRFSLLSGLDSLGGGFLTTAMMSYFFFKRFGIDESLLGPLFFAARCANIFSHLGAAWIAARIGLVRTMVFTHIPSSLLLMTVPFMPDLRVAVILFLLREALVEMDVPTRQSYLMAVVKPVERVHAAGISNLTRGVAWGAAPMFAGWMSSIALSAPILIGPGLKIIYDFLLYSEFRRIRPPEEISRHS